MTRSKTRWLVLALLAGGTAQAQVTPATDADLRDAPPQFKESLSNGRIKPDASELTRQNVQGSPPSKDPHDLNGMYAVLRAPGGPPPGGPPPGGGGGRSNVGAGACVISGFPGITSYSTTILINPRQVVFLMEENHQLRWARFAATHDPAAIPSFGGDSIARWEGDTLVVDTTLAKSRGAAGLGHYVERFTKAPDGNVAIERFQVADDGGQKLIEKTGLRWRPDLHYVEDICEDFGEAFGLGYK